MSIPIARFHIAEPLVNWFKLYVRISDYDVADYQRVAGLTIRGAIDIDSKSNSGYIARRFGVDSSDIMTGAQLDDAAKLVCRVERALEKNGQKRGYASSSFGEWVAECLTALKIGTMLADGVEYGVRNGAAADHIDAVANRTLARAAVTA